HALTTTQDGDDQHPRRRTCAVERQGAGDEDMKGRRAMQYCVLFGMVGLFACGDAGGPLPAATFSGTVEGRPFSPVEAMSASGSIAVLGPGTNINMAVVVLSDAAGQCATFTANGQLKSQMYLVILLADFDPRSGAASAPAGIGIYTVIPFEQSDGSTLP